MTARPILLLTLGGYAVEGGFDRRYEPATCYSPTIALGRHAGPGVADGLWTDYERVLEIASELGLDGVRLSVEWARVEPRRGHVDYEALDRYAQVVSHAASLGLHVTIALVDAAWPAWLGLEAWLLPWVVPHVLGHAKRVVAHVGDARGVVVFADARRLTRGGYVEGTLPPWRRGEHEDAKRAQRQIEEICARLEADPVVGAKIVREVLTIDLQEGGLRDARAATQYAEVHVRSLVKGTGPTEAPSGLLVRHSGEWTLAPSPDVLDLLR